MIRLISLMLLLVVACSTDAKPRSSLQALEHAKRLLKSTPLIDGHNDLPYVIRESHAGEVEAHDIRQRAPGDTDLVRLREGQVGAQIWSVYVPGTLIHGRFARMQLE